MRRRPAATTTLFALAALACLPSWGCGSKTAITFAIEAPDLELLSPVSDRVSEYTIKKSDGTLVGVASVGPGLPGTLSLGPLMELPQPTDLEVSVLSGAELLGIGRVRDVTIQAGSSATYVAEVRKPLLTLGSALPIETLSGN